MIFNEFTFYTFINYRRRCNTDSSFFSYREHIDLYNKMIKMNVNSEQEILLFQYRQKIVWVINTLSSLYLRSEVDENTSLLHPSREEWDQ